MEINKDIADLEAAEVRRHKKKKFVLCYHNLTVKNCKRASAQIRKLAEVAGGPISIAVVPSIGGVPESEAEYFREEVQKFMDEGYEILLHGARHRADLFVVRSFVGKLSLAVSNNGAEFAGLSANLSSALLKRSIDLWNSHGFDGRPSGFVPPVWIGNRFLKNQVLAQFGSHENLCYIFKNKGKKSIFSQLLTFSVIPRFLQGVALVLAGIALVVPFGTPRLVIHTDDFKTIGEKSLCDIVRCGCSVREKIMYKDL